MNDGSVAAGMDVFMGAEFGLDDAGGSLQACVSLSEISRSLLRFLRFTLNLGHQTSTQRINLTSNIL